MAAPQCFNQYNSSTIAVKPELFSILRIWRTHWRDTKHVRIGSDVMLTAKHKRVTETRYNKKIRCFCFKPSSAKRDFILSIKSDVSKLPNKPYFDLFWFNKVKVTAVNSTTLSIFKKGTKSAIFRFQPKSWCFFISPEMKTLRNVS